MVRLDRRLKGDAPTLARHVAAWTRSLAGGASPERYFTEPSAFPLLLLPWWLEESVTAEHDPAFGRDLVYSSVTGYLAVRLVDDLMDGDATFERPMTAAIIVLQTEFRSAVAPAFPAGHPFWDDLERWSVQSAELAARDAELRRIDRSTFELISARKTIGAKIPLSAMASRYGRRDALPSWLEFVDIFGRWHQMANDTRDWARDLAAGRPSYFLTTATDQAGPGGSVGEWIVSGGLTWAYGELDGWMGELESMAARLGSRSLVTYIDGRARMTADERSRVEASMPALRRLAEATRS